MVSVANTIIPRAISLVDNQRTSSLSSTDTIFDIEIHPQITLTKNRSHALQSDTLQPDKNIFLT